MRAYKIGVRDFLRIYAPTFCWCTAHDLLLMAEQIPELEDVTTGCFKNTLSQLKALGYFMTKQSDYKSAQASRGVFPDLYLRVK